MRSCELFVLQNSHRVGWHSLKVMPTVCLVAVENIPDQILLEQLVRNCLSIGTVVFAVYGASADELEERIDTALENGGDERGRMIVTTSHQNEKAEDVANFLINAAYVGNAPFRCLVILEREIAGEEPLLQELHRLCVDCH